MKDIFILYDIMNGYLLEFLDFFVLICMFLGVFIIVTKNPIISVLFLMLLFSAIACYLVLIGIKFIGLSYLLVYVGAVSILFIFILMLINIRVSELINDTNNNTFLALLAIITFVFLFTSVTSIDNNSKILADDVYMLLQLVKAESEIYVTSKNWESTLVDMADITCIGNIMYSSYSIWLLITSIILLLAMVGAIVITIKKI